MTVGEPVEKTGSTRDGDLDPDVGTESVDAVTTGADGDEPDTEVTDLTPLAGGAADDAVRGVDEVLGREVRLVTLPPVSGEVLSERIEQVRHLARLHHPHLLEVYDVDGLAPDTESTLVLENVSGEPLPLVLLQGPIDDADLTRMGAQLASALSHAHAHHVHHGAIGPSSVLVDRRRSAAWLVGLTASLTGPLPVIDAGVAETPDDEAALRAADVRALARTLADVAALGAPTGDDPEAETQPATRSAPVSPLLALLRDVDTALPPTAAAFSERLVRLGRDETADTDDVDSSRLVPVVASWTDASASPDDATAAVLAAGPAVRARGANGITPFGVVAGPARRTRRAGVLGAATATLALASGLVIYAGESHVVRPAPQAEVGTALPVTAAVPPVLPGLPAQPVSDRGSGSSGSSGYSGRSDDETPAAPRSSVGSTSPSAAPTTTPVPVVPSTPARVVPPVQVPTQPTAPPAPVEPTTEPVEPPAEPVEPTKPSPSSPGATPPPATVATPPATATTTTTAPGTTMTTPLATTTAPTTTTTAPGAPAAVLAAGLPG